MRANYGRFSLTICNTEGVTDWSVNCMAPRSLRIVQDRYALIYYPFPYNNKCCKKL